MDKSLSRKQNTTFKMFALFFGTIIGAGFTSGREIYVYFGRFGGWGLATTILAGFLFFLLGFMFFQLGKKCKADTMQDFLKLTFGKFAKIAEIVIAFSYLIVVAAMFAGFDSIQKILFPSEHSFPFLMIASVALCIFVTFGGIESIKKINYILLPAIVVFVVIIFFVSVTQKEQSIAFVLFDTSILGLVSPIISCAIFVCSNMFLTGFILMKAGTDNSIVCNKQASLVTGIVVFAICFFSCFSLALNPSSINFEMPFLCLSFKVGDWFVIFSVIVLWLAIFTTAVASLYTLSWWLNSYVKSEKFSVIFCALLAILLSRLGFSSIVDKLYPLTGAMDVLFVLLSIWLYIRKRK